jgi:CheY-like chemotaxis protein
MGARVLVVDDDDDLRGTVCETLEDAGYDTVGARDGSEALSTLRAQPCRLILLDLMMPGMNGWQFRDAQLQEPELAMVPVVVMTASRHPDVATVRANEVLPKPVNLDRLLDTVRRHCGEP